MKRYLFCLGTAADLAACEIHHVLAREGQSPETYSLQDDILQIDSSQPLDTPYLMSQLGGTIKIAEIIQTTADIGYEQLAVILSKQGPKLRDFGVSVYGKRQLPIVKWLQQIKTALEQKGIKARYVLAKEQQLSSVVVKKQKLQEYILFFDSQKSEWLIAATLVVQDVDAWSARDYSRPFADPKSGMLPPKVARMMVNISLPQLPNPMIYDPFCGMGTILAEGLLMGATVYGSDYLDPVVQKAQANITWLQKTYPQTNEKNVSVFVADATHKTEHIAKNTLDAIVTEPFMGAPFEMRGTTLYHKRREVNVKTVENMTKGLEKLYIGAFRNWHGLLKDKGKICIVLPHIQYQNRHYSVKKLVDNCERLGYTLSEGPYMYARPQAIVKRYIYVFKKS